MSILRASSLVHSQHHNSIMKIFVKTNKEEERRCTRAKCVFTLQQKSEGNYIRSFVFSTSVLLVESEKNQKEHIQCVRDKEDRRLSNSLPAKRHNFFKEMKNLKPELRTCWYYTSVAVLYFRPNKGPCKADKL